MLAAEGKGKFMAFAGRFVLSILGALALAACGVAEMDVGVDENIAEFRSQVSNKEYGEIWDRSHPVMQQSSGRDAFIAFMTAVTKELGAAGESKQTAWKKNSGTNGTTVVILRETQFRNGTGFETFTFGSSEDGEALELVGYHINSERLAELDRRLREAQASTLQEMAQEAPAAEAVPAE